MMSPQQLANISANDRSASKPNQETHAARWKLDPKIHFLY
jgi:hypothetical protein